MVLNVDFSALHDAVRKMGAEQRDFDVGRIELPIDPIDLQLERGIELPDLNDIEIDNGLLSYKGRQILLYIQDQGSKITEVLQEGDKGTRFHVADCRTLKEMRRKGRFERYVVTNNISGSFYVTGKDWSSEEELNGHTILRVCQNCIKALNYKGAKQGQAWNIAAFFSIEEFFSTYSSFFTHLPSRTAGKQVEEGYSADWPQISARYKTSQNFKCECCSVDLSNHKRLLHVHHLNGVKSDNSMNNLRALCAACHKEQPHHSHMFVPHKDKRLINHLRRVQALLSDPSKWEQVMRYADPGLMGLLNICRNSGAPAPDVGVLVQDSNGEVVANLEVGWRRCKVGVAIDDDDVKKAQVHGWKIWSMFGALSQIDRFLASVR